MTATGLEASSTPQKYMERQTPNLPTTKKHYKYKMQEIKLCGYAILV